MSIDKAVANKTSLQCPACGAPVAGTLEIKKVSDDIKVLALECGHEVTLKCGHGVTLEMARDHWGLDLDTPPRAY